MLKKEEASKPRKSSVLFFAIYGLSGILISMLFAALFAILISSETLTTLSFETAAYASAFFGALFSGFFTCRKFGKALLSSFILFLLYTGILYFSGMLIFRRLSPMSNILLLLASALVGAVTGALISACFERKHN